MDPTIESLIKAVEKLRDKTETDDAEISFMIGKTPATFGIRITLDLGNDRFETLFAYKELKNIADLELYFSSVLASRFISWKFKRDKGGKTK
jgi:hypothetical protein